MEYRVGTKLSIYSSSTKVDSANFAMPGSPKFALQRRSRRLWRAMVEVSRSGGGQEDNLLSRHLAKYRPHRPHGLECCCLQDFLAVGIDRHHHPRRGFYRSHLTDSDRGLTHRNRWFSGSFALQLTLAVGAVGILTRIYLPQANHVLMRTINTQF